MIEGSLADLTTQGGTSYAPQSCPKAPANKDDGQQNFAKFVENKQVTEDAERQEKQITDKAPREEEISLGKNENTWLGHLLYMAQKSEPTPLMGSSDKSVSMEEESLLLAKKTGTPSPTDLDENYDFVPTPKMALHKGLSASAHKDETGQTKNGEKTSQDKDMSAFVSSTRNMPQADKPQNFILSQPSTLSSQNQAGNESPQPHHNLQKIQDFSHLLMPQQKDAQPLDLGDKISLKNMSATPTPQEKVELGKIEGVDIVRTRKQGDLTLLQLQLTPENLGKIEAKLRLDKDHLYVEVNTTKSETAKILTKDYHLLVQSLEKAGFGGEGRLTISIIEHDGTTLQPVSSSNFQSGEQNMADQHEGMQERREQTATPSGFSSNDQDGNHNDGQEENNRKKIIEHKNKPSFTRLNHAVGSSHRLVV